jgi:hypothetical protein
MTLLEDQTARAAAILAPLNALDRDSRIQMLGARLDLFAAATLKIRTKQGGPLLPFAVNPIQMDYLRTIRRRHAVEKGIDKFRGIRDAIVKPRQLGFSTFIAALFFMDGIKNPGRVTVVLSHDKDISEILLETYRLFFEHLPANLQGALTLESDTKYEFEVVFPGDQAVNPPSKFIIDTEAGHPWRGGVIHNLHASEAAFYRNFPGFMASYVQGVGADGNILLETTANGQNDYYRLVMQAMEGASPYDVVFYPWFRHPEYRLPWTSDQAPIQCRNEMERGHEEESEQALMEREGLDLQQIAWRRNKMKELGDLFMQEYPESLLGAFLSTGRPFFDAKIVNTQMEAARKLPRPQSPRANVFILENPVPGEVYLIPADVAEGKDAGTTDISDPERGGGDFCTAPIIKVRELRVVGWIHGRITPIAFAQLLMGAGRLYGWACLAVERNNHGHSTLNTLETSGYPQVYRHLEYDGVNSYLRPGFPTDPKTRPQIVDALDTAIRSGSLIHPDPGFWRECSTFQRGPTGRPEALPGCHDDRVMAMAIGAYLCTLGRNAWGLTPMEGANAAGFPQGPVAPDPAPAPPSPIPLPPTDPTIFDALTQAKAEMRRVCCGTCNSYPEGCPAAGMCATNRFTCHATDPSCTWYYPREIAGVGSDIPPISGEVAW